MMRLIARVAVVPLILVCVLLAAGCGGEEEVAEPNDPGDTAGQGTAPEESEPANVTFAIATNEINVAYPFATLPIEMGWFEEEGLEVEVVPGTASQNTIQALVSGQADVGLIVPDLGVIGRINEGIEIRSIYPVARLSYTFAVPPDSPIESVEDIQGKKVGHVSLGAGTVPYAAVRYEEAGFSADDVESIAVGYGPPAMEAMEGGTVDAIAGFTAMWKLLEGVGYDFRLLPEASWQSNLHGFVVYATDSYIEENADVIARLGRAMSKAIVFAQANPEATVRIFWKQFPDKAPADPNDEAALARDLGALEGQLEDMGVFSREPEYPWGSQDAEEWSAMQDFLLRTELVEEAADPAELFFDGVEDEYINFDPQEIVEQAEAWTSE